ncbi:hypothetical protein PCCS19_12020 [Paenibacillus sp. CCS19]|uniref:hypothetical protein n=1 Tax=Paenibacillus sp. CCS19 TaxID=3158387 RepID=UPI00256DC732|nr:hypothetical protein [Paenibacillus cellulosilyticus]GMK38148.1 hypothetical protein PCCS19_12020 [Paenibacillus cellulosilyticus]
MSFPLHHAMAVMCQLVLSSILMPVIVYLCAPVMMTGSLSTISASVIAVYASLLILSHAIGIRVMKRNAHALAMIIPTVLVADAAAMLVGMNWYGTTVIDLLIRM